MNLNTYNAAPYELARTYGVKSGVYHAYKFLYAECGLRDMPAMKVITRANTWSDFLRNVEDTDVQLCKKCFGSVQQKRLAA